MSECESITMIKYKVDDEEFEDTIITTFADWKSVQVNLQENTVICNKIFNISHRHNFVRLTGSEVIHVETEFLKNQEPVQVVKITATKIQTIRKHTFKDLEVKNLILEKNQISIIEEEAFFNLPLLDAIQINGNRLCVLNSNSFKNLPKMATFIAQHNKIKSLENSFFQIIKKDNGDVNLIYNKLNVLKKDFFAGLFVENMGVSLGVNQIKELPVGIFDGYSFKFLDLSHNLITDISEEFLQDCVRIQVICFDKNVFEEKKEIEIREKMGLWKNEWWDKECRERKQAARKKLRNWKKEKATKEEYKRARKRYKLVCKEKKEKKRMEEEMKMKGIKTEEEVWRYINRERKRKGEIVSDRITMEEWRKYFSELLGGEENRQEKEKRQHRVGEIEEITREELEQQLRKLKRKKAPGRDGIQNESWIYGTEREVDRLLEIMNGVWKGEGFPQEWKEGIICPIYKKGEKDTASNYRGITLLNTAYKVYAMIVEERLMKEMNERGALPDGQAGFRKDLKAAFDNVERDLLWEYLRKKGINEHLVTKIEEIYEETISRVRVDGRVVVGKEKVWSLAYADDLVVLAREEKGMKEMLGNMEKYMRRKKLTVNVEKSKMMVFRKGGGRRKINEWRWEKDKIEEVKEFKYLGYVMNERNTAAAHVRELVKKANKIIGAVWGIGERKFGHDFRRRIMMFDSLVKSVVMYGAEIWGWREQEGL
ncbi:hypothetical protein GEV33_004337 [Tenebrio molitor]|uniref:Reverse transcriptase domain-containing protein n=1 Tax=Tenebrio molitor TaxID=7067 RepID=A0A8J6LDH0_TENMO|nr:hypothetical protein GEV33_004337 [Tenebrio molitor]